MVAVEDPGYRAAWQAFRAHGARLVPLAVDRHGLDVEALRVLCRRTRVRAVYLTPHHQYPTTVTLGPGRRLALLELKQKAAALAVGIGLGVGAALFALFALGFAFATAAAALATVLATWLALLIVTGALLLLAGTLALLALRSIKSGVPPVPEQAIEEAKRTSEAVKADGGQRSS